MPRHGIHARPVAALETATRAEFLPDNTILNRRRPIDVQPECEDGHLPISDRPGLGFNLDEAAGETFA